MARVSSTDLEYAIEIIRETATNNVGRRSLLDRLETALSMTNSPYPDVCIYHSTTGQFESFSAPWTMNIQVGLILDLSNYGFEKCVKVVDLKINPDNDILFAYVDDYCE